MNDPMNLINRRRRQLHVHSIIYYHLNTSIVEDAVFDKWANELVALHKNHPNLVNKGYMPSTFADWTGDTGMHLPAKNDVLALAEWLVAYAQKNNHAQGQAPKREARRGEVGDRRV